ncbi:MAG TPA: MFS transporter [Vicinamibacterales bacterium]|nr:MFS transporter [Vicinamibacterales bacterium]
MGFAGFTLVMPFLPLYFGQLGVKDTSAVAVWSGVCLGVTPAITAAMAPVWARLADRFGRKMMVARSLFSFFVIMALMAFVTAPWHVLVLRIIQGFFAGYGPIALTMAAESAPPDEVATAIGWVQTAQRLGPALGPVIGGALAQALGLRRSFIVSAGVYLAAFALVLAAYREKAGPRVPVVAGRPAGTTFAELRRYPHFLLFMATVFGLQLVDRSLGPILPLYLEEIGFDSARVPFLAGILFTTTACAGAAGNQAARFLLARVPAGSLVPGMMAVSMAGTVLFSLAGPWMSLLAVAAGFGFALGVATTSIYTSASQTVPIAARGAAFAYLSSAYLVALAVSPVVAGFLGAASMRSVFVADAAGLAVLAWIVRREMSHAAN